MISAEEAKRLTDKSRSSIEIQNEINSILEKISSKIEETANKGENACIIGYFDEIYQLMHPEPDGMDSYSGIAIRTEVKNELSNAGYIISDVNFDNRTLLKIEW